MKTNKKDLYTDTTKPCYFCRYRLYDTHEERFVCEAITFRNGEPVPLDIINSQNESTCEQMDFDDEWQGIIDESEENGFDFNAFHLGERWVVYRTEN